MKRNREESIAEYALSPSVEIVGRGECYVDKIKRISKLTKENIVFELKEYSVSVSGSELYIGSFSGEGAQIMGNITLVEFLENAESDKISYGNG
ncbi:MAG: YabP/YqfC family sporulation protein [Eubacterium sp.]|nr:YabP/YqfC family sporulation protein [Eubacterium sp.]